MNLEREEGLPLRGTDGTLEAWLRGGEAAAAAPPPPPLRDGDRFGPCRVLGLLGRGGASDVFRAVQEPSGIAVALKVLRPGGGEAAAVRFAREVRLLAEHPHPALPRYLGSGEAEGRPYLLLEELAPAPLPRTDRAVARFLLALCRGVAHLHALGFVHRDIKPDNVLFRANGAPVLIDFGLVKNVGERPSGPPAAGGPSIVEGRRVGVAMPDRRHARFPRHLDALRRDFAEVGRADLRRRGDGQREGGQKWEEVCHHARAFATR